eukprot:15040924-Alexandrium_andersonii.AAC.1
MDHCGRPHGPPAFASEGARKCTEKRCSSYRACARRACRLCGLIGPERLPGREAGASMSSLKSPPRRS